jgi:hypothetical protein
MQWSISLGANKPEVLQKAERTIWKAILNIVNQPGDYLSIMKDLSLEFNSSYLLELENDPETMAGWFIIPESDNDENSLPGGEAGVNTRDLTGNNMNVGVAGVPDDARGAIEGNQEEDGNTGGANQEADGNTGGPGNQEADGNTGGANQEADGNIVGANQEADGNTGGPGNQEAVGNTGGANQEADGNTGGPGNQEADGNTGGPGNQEAEGNTGGANQEADGNIGGANQEADGNTGGPGNQEADGITEMDHGIDGDEPRRSSRANNSIEYPKSLSKKRKYRRHHSPDQDERDDEDEEDEAEEARPPSNRIQLIKSSKSQSTSASKKQKTSASADQAASSSKRVITDDLRILLVRTTPCYVY